MIDVNTLFYNHAILDDGDKDVDIEFLVKLIDSFSRISCLSTFAIDFDKHELIYRSDQLAYIDEATPSDFQRECSNPYWSLVSEEILERLIDIRTHYIQFGADLSVDEFQKHIVTLDYPIILRGHSLFIAQKFTPLIMRSDGIVRVGLFRLTCISPWIVPQRSTRKCFHIYT